jgi:hypothetical protein
LHATKELKLLFHIRSGKEHSPQQVLSLRIGEKHAAFAITNRTGDSLYELVYCVTQEWDETGFNKFLQSHECLKNDFYQVMISFDFPQSQLTPTEFYNQDHARLMLETVHGRLGSCNLISEFIADRQLYNVYAVPRELQEWLARAFPSGSIHHQYSVDLRNSDIIAGDRISIDFRTDEFVLLATRGKQILLARVFAYASPEDVLYYVLKTCQQFSISQRDCTVQISGLIDKGSSLYKELHHYFLNLFFNEPGWENDENEFPPHFFTSLNQLAKCVS